MNTVSVMEVIFKLCLAEFTVEGFPCVRSNEGTDLLVFISAEPLPQALQMHVSHGARTFTWGYQRIFFVTLI